MGKVWYWTLLANMIMNRHHTTVVAYSASCEQVHGFGSFDEKVYGIEAIVYGES